MKQHKNQIATISIYYNSQLDKMSYEYKKEIEAMQSKLSVRVRVCHVYFLWSVVCNHLIVFYQITSKNLSDANDYIDRLKTVHQQKLRDKQHEYAIIIAEKIPSSSNHVSSKMACKRFTEVCLVTWGTLLSWPNFLSRLMISSWCIHLKPTQADWM